MNFFSWKYLVSVYDKWKFEIFTSVFFLSLLFPLQTHIGEAASFWQGGFSSLSTLFWSASLCVLSLLLVFSGIELFQKKTSSSFLALFYRESLLWGLFFILSGISIWLNTAWESGAFFLLLWLLGGLFVFLLWFHSVRTKYIVIVLLIAGVAEAIFGILQTFPTLLSSVDLPPGAFLLKSEFREVLRAHGSFLHPNILGFFLVSIFFLSEILEKKWWIFRGVLLLGLVCTFSRSAFVALSLGGFLAYVLRKDSSQKSHKHFFLLIFVALVGVILRLLLDDFSTSSFERISQTFIAFDLVTSHPFIGIGWGNFSYFMARFDTFFPWQLQPVHNTFLLVMSELGILAFVIFSAFLVRLWSLIKSLKKKRRRKTMFLGLSGVLASFLFFEHLILTSEIGFFLSAFFVALIFQATSQDL